MVCGTPHLSDTANPDRPSEDDLMVTLYRGLAVSPDDVDSVAAQIREDGLIKVDGMTWGTCMPSPTEVRAQVSDLRASPARIRSELQKLPVEHVICACGDEFGATHYAVSHSKSEAEPCGLLVTFSMPAEQLCIDGKDFLYTVFQLWDRNQTHHRDVVRDILEMIYGPSILSYFNQASEIEDTIERCGVCDLACHDLDVIRHHVKNSILIRGRYQTQFCSAFQMQAPIPSSSILAISGVDVAPKIPERSIDLRTLVP